MDLKNTETSFGIITKLLHWVIALLIIGLLAVGIYMEQMPVSPDKFKLYSLHKSFGVTVLFLMVLRLGWRIINKVPAPLGTPEKWELAAAKITHITLYIAAFGMPLSGWIMSSAANYKVSYFGLFTLPDLIGPDKAINGLMSNIHFYLGYALIGIIALHIAGALKHHIIDKNDTLRRMLPFKLALLLIITATTPALAKTPPTGPLPQWKLVTEKSSIHFSGTQMAAPFSGQFKNFETEITFDPDYLDLSTVKAEIDLASVDTQSAERDNSIQGSQWFYTAKHPKAVFQSTKFVKTDGNQYDVQGNLTIRDVTKPITFPFHLALTDSPNGRLATMDAEVTLNRLEFGLGEGEWAAPDIIGHEVTVKIQMVAETSLD